MFMILADGTEIRLSAIVKVSPLVENTYYEIYFESGDHENIKESFKTRAEFLTAWKAV